MTDARTNAADRGSRTAGTTRAAAGMSEAEQLLYRSNLLGSDKRVTNYGGGNTSAKVMETDPLTGEEVEVLWVKGSGGDIGSMKLDGFATLYMDKLRGAEGALSRRRARGRDGGLPAALHLQPEPARRLASTRRCTPMCRSAHVDHVHPDAIIAIAASENSKELTQRDLRRRDRLAALEAAGLRAGPVAGEVLPREPRGRGRRARKPRPVHLGRRRRRTATTPTLEIINRAIAWLDERTARRAGLRRRDARQPAAGRAARGRGAADAGDPRHGLGRDQHMVGHFDDQDAVLEFVNARDMEPLARARHLLPRPFPAHQDPPAGRRLRPGRRRPRRRRSRACRSAGRGLPRRLRRLLRALQAPRQPGDARPERRGLPRPRRRHDHLRQGQGDGADLGRVLRQRDQRDARRLRRSATIAACPSRRPSTSNTGCWKRPSCSGCRSRSRSPGASRWSPAAPAASARPRRSATCARAPA